MVEAQANVEDPDGDSFEISYQWYVNGELIPAATSSRLPPGVAHRGDKVSVSASATDGSDVGAPAQSAPIVLANAAPVITTQPSYEMTPNGAYTYSLGAKDADGDTPLRYELLEGPEGMKVDDQSGVVTWAVPDNAKGNSTIKIAVSDPYGGRSTQTWVLSVDWNQAPASPSGAAGKATPSAKKAPSAKAAGKVTEKTPPGESDEPAEDEGAAYDEEDY